MTFSQNFLLPFCPLDLENRMTVCMGYPAKTPKWESRKTPPEGGRKAPDSVKCANGVQPLSYIKKERQVLRFDVQNLVHLQGLEPWATDQESKPPVRLNSWKLRVIAIFNQNNVIFHLVISASFVGFCTEKYPLHGLKPCKIRAETVHLLSDK